MAKDYNALAKTIVELVGGEENVISLTHCVTRLRFRLKDESKADTKAMNATKGVIKVMQAGGQYQVVIGNDVTVTMAAEAGQLELNAFEPIIFDSLYQGLVMLQHGIHTLNVHCLQGVRANEEVCRQDVERSVGVVTALCPKIGYNAACSLAREALRTNRPVGKIALERGLLTERELQTLLDPAAMTSRCSLQDTEVDAVKGKM